MITMLANKTLWMTDQGVSHWGEMEGVDILTELTPMENGDRNNVSWPSWLDSWLVGNLIETYFKLRIQYGLTLFFGTNS